MEVKIFNIKTKAACSLPIWGDLERYPTKSAFCRTTCSIFWFNFTTILLLGLLFSATVKGQDIHFSQYNFSPLNVNPALCAVSKNIQVIVNQKNQWKSLHGFRTSAASVELKLKGKKKKLINGLAIGLSAFNDQAGDGALKQNQLNFTLAYHLLLNPSNALSVGLQGGMGQKSIMEERLRWNDQYVDGVYDPTIPGAKNITSQGFNYGDFGGGLVWSYGSAEQYITANNNFFIQAGASVLHINRPHQSFLASPAERLNPKVVLHANSLIGLKNTNLSLAPSFLYMLQGTQSEFIYGMSFKYSIKEESKYTKFVKGTAFSLGAYHRQNALVALAVLDIGTYSFGISYDINISQLNATNVGTGGIEVSLRFAYPSLYQGSR